MLAARHYGPGIGLLAGAVQATTAWTVLRGRLAEADILLACLVTWAIVAFDRILTDTAAHPSDGPVIRRSTGDSGAGRSWFSWALRLW